MELWSIEVTDVATHLVTGLATVATVSDMKFKHGTQLKPDHLQLEHTDFVKMISISYDD